MMERRTNTFSNHNSPATTRWFNFIYMFYMHILLMFKKYILNNLVYILCSNFVGYEARRSTATFPLLKEIRTRTNWSFDDPIMQINVYSEDERFNSTGTIIRQHLQLSRTRFRAQVVIIHASLTVWKCLNSSTYTSKNICKY